MNSTGLITGMASKYMTDGEAITIIECSSAMDGMVGAPRWFPIGISGSNGLRAAGQEGFLDEPVVLGDDLAGGCC